MDIQETLMDLSRFHSVSGNEITFSSYLKTLLEPYSESVIIDNKYNVIAQISAPKEGKPTLLLDAHLDEIGMVVTYIDDEGFLHIGNCGGIDRRLLLAQEVIVHGEKPIIGIIATIPPHLQKDEDRKKTPEIDDILIDIGMNQKQAEQVVSLGSMVTIVSKSEMLLNDRIKARALDDRAGIVSILKALDYLKGQDLQCGLYVLFSVQEEVGERGAQTGGFSINPDIAIAVDVSFAHTSDAEEHKCGKMGEGVMIGIAPTLNKQISRKMIALAKKEEIPYQQEIMSGDTGTNADALGLTQNGVCTGLLSIPLRYMHTPVEEVQISDIDAVSRLLSVYIKAGEFGV